ncbi:hypothetical protein B0H34DRAFT_390777 [Crassisporium funariophilum]|nr:hypothetical protein B0H34DRAFT_390777 [Crassisporium funariophilum]
MSGMSLGVDAAAGTVSSSSPRFPPTPPSSLNVQTGTPTPLPPQLTTTESTGSNPAPDTQVPSIPTPSTVVPTAVQLPPQPHLHPDPQSIPLPVTPQRIPTPAHLSPPPKRSTWFSSANPPPSHSFPLSSSPTPSLPPMAPSLPPSPTPSSPPSEEVHVSPPQQLQPPVYTQTQLHESPMPSPSLLGVAGSSDRPLPFSSSSVSLSPSPTGVANENANNPAANTLVITVNSDRSTPSSLPSSLDDFVPSLPHTPPGYQQEKPPQSPPLGRTSAMNPTSSRFTLSIPFLGRGKVPLPLGAGLGKGEGEQARRGSSSSTEPSSSSPTSTGVTSIGELRDFMASSASSSIAQAHSLSTSLSSTSSNSTVVPRSSSTPRGESAATPTSSIVNQSEPSSSQANEESAVLAELQARLASAESAVSSSSAVNPAITHSIAEEAKEVPEKELEKVDTERKELERQRVEQGASWWDYMAWSSAVPHNQAETSAASETSTQPQIEAPPVATTSVEISDPVTDTAVDAETNGDVKAGEREVERIAHELSSPEVSATEHGAPDVKVEETVAGTWYAPWAWYYSATTTTTTNMAPGQEHEHGVEEEKPSVSQSVAAPELSQPPHIETVSNIETTEPSITTTTTITANEPEVDANPITTSMQTSSNISGWASFFSSRALMVKTIGYGSTGASGGGNAIEAVTRDENGMEVMDLDLDDEMGGGEVARGRDEAKKDVGQGREVVKRAGNGAAMSVMPHTSSAIISNVVSNLAASDLTSISSKKDKKKHVAPPLIISEEVKKESNSTSMSTTTTVVAAAAKLLSGSSGPSTPKKGASGTNTPVPVPPSPAPSTSSSTGNDKQKDKPSKLGMNASTSTSSTTSSKRTASPAPSKKSIAAPAPPNLVLPTWQDTFHTAPRNVLPPRPVRYVDDQGVGGAVALGAGTGGTGAGVGGKLFGKTMKFMSGVLFAKDGEGAGAIGGAGGGARGKGKERARAPSEREGSGEGSAVVEDLLSAVERERKERFREFGKELPKAWKVFDDAGWDTSLGSTRMGLGRRTSSSASGSGFPVVGKGKTTAIGGGETDVVADVLKGCKRVVVIGVHGWFPGAMIRTVLGEPTGTSTKFSNMMEQALLAFEEEHGVKLEKITKIPLEGDGTIEKRVDRLYSNLKENEEWMSDLHDADAILVATHSQGSIVSTHLLDRLIHDNHIVTGRNQRSVLDTVTGAEGFPAAIGVVGGQPGGRRRKVQRVCCLALCGIHLGPLRYLRSSTLVGPYLQYFESAAALELFEFQNTESAVSKAYMKALGNVLDHGTKMLYVASLNDQVVPIYSGLFTAVSHPLILRALYIDGDAYHSSDFLSNLLILLLRVLNSGMSDSGLLAHLSEATAGSLNGVGHSTAYEEISTYALAVKYLFLTNEGMAEHAQLAVEPFNATHEQNDYEIPWSLRDVIADERVAYFFSREITELRDAFREWHPKTSILRDLKRKLQPITRLPSNLSLGSTGTSKL